MELVGEQVLALPRERVWDALNDPDILRRCVPGCDLFEREDEHRFKVGMTATVGPVKARFNGKLMLAELDPPTSYALSFEGSGGAAGFGKGDARVMLADADSGGTRLTYTVHAQVGGKLSQVGSRLIDGVARKMADEFFSRFAKAMSSAVVPTAASLPSAASVLVASSAPPRMPTSSPLPLPTAGVPPPAAGTSASNTVAVLCASVAVLGASVAVLAAVVAVYVVR